MIQNNTILIIGGTGMLKEASEHFSKNNNVYVLARSNSKKLQQLQNITPIEVDYYNIEQTTNTLKPLPQFDIIIAWVHPDQTKYHEPFYNKLREDGKYFEVTGSSNLSSLQDVTPRFTQNYKRIILGRKGARWLTHQEISQGTIKAIEDNRTITIIGEL